MRIRLPVATFDLNFELDVDTRLEVVNQILQKELTLDEETMTVEEYLRMTWFNEDSKNFMDMLGYYLAKEDKDLSVLSTKRIKEMENGSERHTTFSSMGMENQLATGVLDADDYNY